MNITAIANPTIPQEKEEYFELQSLVKNNLYKYKGKNMMIRNIIFPYIKGQCWTGNTRQLSERKTGV